jgi:hypothetical protein
MREKMKNDDNTDLARKLNGKVEQLIHSLRMIQRAMNAYNDH